MEVTSVQSGQSSSLVTQSSQLNKDGFLQLLLTQLQNQDPLDPMDTNEFMSQLQQMGVVEELTNLNSSFEAFAGSNSMLTATALIGKTVTFTDTTGGTQSTGVVDHVKVQDGTTQVYVNGEAVSLTDIVSVSD